MATRPARRSAGWKTPRCCRPAGRLQRLRCFRARPPGTRSRMYVGNLEHYQGIDLLLEGFRHTLDRVPEARLVIVGGRQDDIDRYTQR